MSILKKAKELGEAIASSVELEKMKNAELAMMNDSEASNLVAEFNNRQRFFIELSDKGEELTAEQLTEVEEMEKRVMDNELIVTFFRKQQNFERILEEINDIIARSIAGDNLECDDEDCSSCDGCN
ncbi:MAG: YlbF family regulator [Peptococcaceae bacterium]|nr:YlbF family regulator [Peptococcaceae bacterium]